RAREPKRATACGGRNSGKEPIVRGMVFVLSAGETTDKTKRSRGSTIHPRMGAGERHERTSSATALTKATMIRSCLSRWSGKDVMGRTDTLAPHFFRGSKRNLSAFS